MADYPKFVESGHLTEKGLHLVEWIEAQYRDFDKPGADANVAALNSLHGPIAEYYVNVEKLKSKTPAGWLESFPQSARNAYDIMVYVAEQAEAEKAKEQAVTEATNKSNAVADELTKFKESIAAQVAELEQQIAALRTENESLKAAKTEEKVEDEPAVEATAEPVKTGRKAKKQAEAEVEPSAEETPETEAKTEGETPAESE